MPDDFDIMDVLVVVAGFLTLAVLVQIVVLVLNTDTFKQSVLYSYTKFCYASFLKPHANTSEEGGQQSALESFYATQAAVYDATRQRLLCGRKELLGLMAAQLKYRMHHGAFATQKPVWVDIGGGTGFQRLGWKNVSVVCEDARTFSLPRPGTFAEDTGTGSRYTADIVTMSYSLSMIPDYYSVIDSISSLLDPKGIIAVVDFYVQSIVDVSTRNYIGGAFNRHVNWLGRVFWRAWFDCDRVSLEGARRDFLEYRFGTITSVSQRNYLMGGIPYYLFVGCHKHSTARPQNELEKVNASLTESPYLSAIEHRKNEARQEAISASILSKACEAAVVNLSSNLPLPSTFYQNHHWRIYYNDLLQKHTQFQDEYIYAFNWEDPRADIRLLNINSSDVLLTITSAGDNILDYLLESPRRVHAVDLNPNQNHLLELKVAAFTALPHSDVWQLFGLGRHPDFRNLLIQKLSPHLSSQALQYWLEHTSAFTSKHGLYETGGSRHAVRLVRWLVNLFKLNESVRQLLNAGTLNEQREAWPRIHSINEVVARIAPATLTIAVIMDSMDWFPHPSSKNTLSKSTNSPTAAEIQVTALNRVLRLKTGRVFLRSAGLRPW
ncbi:putative sialidase [Phaeomoniella chlamydospora]|uniref:Putative sialidase n=1 Tax=Phaeomoniella chlamydospora TaxID=158046 RepID=A0A0G2H823_PHACM|nr:putative sialidase [Phaeomoniella chlamydospora]